jgi:hypothetical protein
MRVALNRVFLCATYRWYRTSCVCERECRRHHFLRIARFKVAKIVCHSVFEILSSQISFLFHCFINIFSKSFWFLKKCSNI